MSKIVQSGGFLGRFFGTLLKSDLSLIGKVLKSVAKSFLIPLGLTPATLATDAAIHKTIFGSRMTILIISNEEMNDIMKKTKSLEKSVLLINGVSKTYKMKEKNKKADFSVCY